MNVQIVIRGRQFNVKTMDGASIKRRAKELDRRLNEQFERSRSFDEHSILMITALNILNELNLMKQQYAEQLQELELYRNQSLNNYCKEFHLSFNNGTKIILLQWFYYLFQSSLPKIFYLIFNLGWSYYL